LDTHGVPWKRPLSDRIALPFELARWQMLRGLAFLGFEFPVRAIRLTKFTEPDFFRETVATFDGVFIDIGASSGYYILQAKKASAVIGFEPDPRFWEQLERARVECGKDCTISHDVVLDSVGSTEFSLSSGLFGSRVGGVSEKRRVMNDVSQKIVSMTTTLDAIEVPEGPVLVKMDTEGAEHVILKGAREFVRKRQPTFLIEYHSNLPQVLQALSLFGYEWTGNTFWQRLGWIRAYPSPAAGKH
jgi:FkbM family methyltransferase